MEKVRETVCNQTWQTHVRIFDSKLLVRGDQNVRKQMLAFHEDFTSYHYWLSTIESDALFEAWRENR